MHISLLSRSDTPRGFRLSPVMHSVHQSNRVIRQVLDHIPQMPAGKPCVADCWTLLQSTMQLVCERAQVPSVQESREGPDAAECSVRAATRIAVSSLCYAQQYQLSA
jgi:hypothetical protein